MVGLVYVPYLIRMGPPRCSSWHSTQDCSNSQQNHRHANHCCSCRRQSPGSTGSGLLRPPNPLKIFTLLVVLVYPGEFPGSPGRYAAGCSQERAAPMSQVACDTRPLKYTAEPPTRKPSLQVPPTTA